MRCYISFASDKSELVQIANLHSRLALFLLTAPAFYHWEMASNLHKRLYGLLWGGLYRWIDLRWYIQYSYWHYHI